MDQITLKNFRCFREEQTARLAPLTLLVGENSTGKTSFLGMIRALWDVSRFELEDFKEDPYDLGSFDEIVHHRGGSAGRAESFQAGFVVTPRAAREKALHAGGNGQPHRFEVTFKKRGTVPVPVRVRHSHEEVWIESRFQDSFWQISFGTPGGAWRTLDTFRSLAGQTNVGDRPDLPFFFQIDLRLMLERVVEPIAQSSESPTSRDWKLIHQLGDNFRSGYFGKYRQRPYASAPVRSKPRRTYDPSRTIRDPEGDYIPMYLAEVYSQNKEQWNVLKTVLGKFGRISGLFDEVSVKPLGTNESGPFQVQIRKYGKRAKGPKRNLIDVGYGVSQVLPVITELLRPDAPSMFLLQQPEVHLHPSAQAALGSLFCQVASQNRQLVVETHSDHLLDRVRMDVRDGATPLKPEDVSILFFERGDLEVRIHSLRVDKEGNILDAPDNYRRFFLEEVSRSLWKR